MLIDRATIFVRSGKGGDGCVSLRREKYLPKGGPDGGDGGCGGDVVMHGDASVTTLLMISSRPHFRAKKGRPGMGRSKHGADGADCHIRVPLGTLVYEAESGELLADITTDGQRHVAAAGGRGGFGNEHFKSATNQTPREGTPGGPMVGHTLRLELKLIADVGLIGMPNAGKTTMLRAISGARPKVADYPFTTLDPNLGIAELSGERRLVIADIPGLIEGAAEGAGLGHDFLRHVERTRILVHVLDLVPTDGSDPAGNYRAIRRELDEYSETLAEKPELVALNKIDLVPEPERESRIAGVIAGLDRPADWPTPVVVSGVSGDGTRDMLEAGWRMLDKAPAPRWLGQREGVP